MLAIQIINTIFYILNFLAVIPGLWIAGLLLPSIISWIQVEQIKILISKGPGRYILWIALGQLFSWPILDILGWIHGWTQINNPGGEYPSIIGYIPGSALTIVPLALCFLVYGAVIWILRSIWRYAERDKRVERISMVFCLASLVYHLVVGTSERLWLFQLPNPLSQANIGAAGALIGTVLGLIVLAIILLILNMSLPDKTDPEQ
jgi:hypothetical protein